MYTDGEYHNTAHILVDPWRYPSYISTMENNDSNNDLDLKKLEVRVEELIRICNRLKQENSTLRTSQSDLVNERAELVEKTELARTRVESMITRLKTLESSS